MKKQTKLVATLSTAALLALGFSAVSMAAGWDNSTGVWKYLNNDGSEVTDEWKSANGNWFYLDSDGVMATDKLIEDESGSKTKYYYVDQYGAMVKNTWKAVAMDDDDNTDLDAEYWWYYFGSDGKAYTTDSDKALSKSKVKTINGLKYAFDNEGHMLYGWTEADNHTQNDDDKQLWQTAKYYFNGWNDGHAQTGWAQINVEKEDGDTEDYWFYFNGDGEKQAGKRKKINGVYYVFAEDGHMIDEWTIETVNASGSKVWGNNFSTKSNAASISYVNGDGAQRKNTWIWAIPDEDWIPEDYDDDEYSWFYAGKDGKLVTDEVKKINGKKYAFDSEGRMQTGFVTVTGDNSVGTQYDHDKFTREEWIDKDLQNLKYFSSDKEKDGAMKTGYQNIELADDTYQFYFQTKGEAMTKYDSKIKKFTIAGLVLKPTADDDNNYAAVTATKDANGVLIPSAITTEFSKMKEDNNQYLVNKQGTLVKNKTVKDENDHYFLTDGDGQIVKVAYDKDAYNDAKDKKEWVKD